MKVSELKSRLENMRDDDEVVIRIQTMAGSVGPLPTVSVTSAHAGFDWDRGKVFLKTEQDVHIAGEVYEKEQKSSRDKGEALAFIWMTMANNKIPEAEKIKGVKATIKRFGFNV